MSEEVWCLKVITAHPDWKRPYSTTEIFHFRTEKEAEERAKKAKLEYFRDFGMLDEDEEELTDSRIAHLEDHVYDYIYRDSYMDMPPIETNIFKVNFL